MPTTPKDSNFGLANRKVELGNRFQYAYCSTRSQKAAN